MEFNASGFQSYIETCALIFSIIILYWIYILPAYKILFRALRRIAHYSWFRSFIEFIGLLKYGVTAKHLYQAARLRIELELLHPQPEKPGKLDFVDQDAYQAALKRYQHQLSDWKGRIRDQLGGLIRESCMDEAVIPLETCFELLKAEEDILHYFEVLATDSAIIAHKKNQFLSKVRIENGFVSPIFLLSGLLTRFDEDWKLVLQDYGAMIHHPIPGIAQDFREFRAFQFDCWILWGPSIPICTCSLWQGRSTAIQYGYGDENNSLALIHTSHEPLDVILKDLIKEPKPGEGFRVLAAQSSVTGIIKLEQSLRANDFCPAQQAICAEASGRFVLECDHHLAPDGGNRKRVQSAYYSAYLWLLFIVCDQNGQPLYADPWLNLLPFFEHGNIADSSNILILKRLLVEKALFSANDILKQNPKLTLYYACAFDDSGCGSPMRFPPPKNESIQALLKEKMANQPSFKSLNDEGRLRFAQHDPLWMENHYSACNLPEILQTYYAKIQLVNE